MRRLIMYCTDAVGTRNRKCLVNTVILTMTMENFAVALDFAKNNCWHRTCKIQSTRKCFRRVEVIELRRSYAQLHSRTFVASGEHKHHKVLLVKRERQAQKQQLVAYLMTEVQ
jgi:hypothetical protein